MRLTHYPSPAQHLPSFSKYLFQDNEDSTHTLFFHHTGRSHRLNVSAMAGQKDGHGGPKNRTGRTHDPYSTPLRDGNRDRLYGEAKTRKMQKTLLANVRLCLFATSSRLQ